MDHAQDLSRSGEVRSVQASTDICVQRAAHFNRTVRFLSLTALWLGA